MPDFQFFVFPKFNFLKFKALSLARNAKLLKCKADEKNLWKYDRGVVVLRLQRLLYCVVVISFFKRKVI